MTDFWGRFIVGFIGGYWATTQINGHIWRPFCTYYRERGGQTAEHSREKRVLSALQMEQYNEKEKARADPMQGMY